MKEAVHHPAHYRKGPYEAILVIEAWGAGFNVGNALKYICRAESKGQESDDYRKACWYLLRALARHEGKDPDHYNALIDAARSTELIPIEIVERHPSDQGKCLVCKLAIEADRNAQKKTTCKACADEARKAERRAQPLAEDRCGRCFKPTGNEFLHDCAGKLLPASWYVENLERGERILDKEIAALKGNIVELQGALRGKIVELQGLDPVDTPKPQTGPGVE